MTDTAPHHRPWLAGWVHVFTAFGVVCALFAVRAISERAFEIAFLWLGVAFLIDALDGLFARRVRVKERLPRFSGDVLDLVIDYLTYVFVPVLALLAANILNGVWGLMLGAVILLSSLFHFADTESKSTDYAFIGFPAIWNVVAFYLFAFEAGNAVTSLVVLALVVLTFVRWPWVHPVRVRALRPVTLAIAALGCATAIWILIDGFPANGLQKISLALVAIYVVALSLIWRRSANHRET